jgi:uncharacterized protein YbjT (DUF2867 family)
MVHIEADIDTIEAKTKDITVDHLFCCIGTTKHKTPNKEEYYRIDHDYPVLVATLFRNKGCKTVSLVSSIGANSNSTSFYLKLKGDTERDIIGLNFESTHIFRPSLLLGKRKEKRKIEDLSKLIMPFINFFLRGNLKNYRSIKAKNVAFAMVNLALSNNNKGNHIYLSQDIKQNA